MSKTTGYAAYAAGAELEAFEFERREVGDEDVAIDILFCGICHSDLHLINNDWKMSQYPIVPGHEVIGRVTQVGSKVTGFSVGEMAGVGCMVDSCQHCQNCKADEEQFCEAGNTLTYNSEDKHLGGMTYGGYSKQMVVDQNFVLHISESLDPAASAPLLCAGITTYSPLKRANIGTNSRVGVIGLGGLGHMAVKIAHAMGAVVTVFTTSENKIEEAKRLGASHVVLSTDLIAMQAEANQFDFILNTVSANFDINLYLNCLTYDGQLTQVGLPTDPMPISMFPVVFKRLSVTGSLIGGIKETQEVLDFCAEHQITSDIEIIKPNEINKALERLKHGDVKYRFVIDMSA
jgi:alcohol dehydrogenase (NADP+)